MALEDASEPLYAGELHKRAEEVDAVRGVELAAEVIEERLALGVDQQPRRVEGAERGAGGGLGARHLGADAVGEESTFVGFAEGLIRATEEVEHRLGEREAADRVTAKRAEGEVDRLREEPRSAEGDDLVVEARDEVRPAEGADEAGVYQVGGQDRVRGREPSRRMAPPLGGRRGTYGSEPPPWSHSRPGGIPTADASCRARRCSRAAPFSSSSKRSRAVAPPGTSSTAPTLTAWGTRRPR